jgi:hypothetical protein
LFSVIRRGGVAMLSPMNAVRRRSCGGALVLWSLACTPSGGPDGAGASGSSGGGSSGEVVTTGSTSTSGTSGASGSTTAVEASSTGADSAGGSSAGATFIVPFDGGICPLECDVWEHQCCGHPDQKCVPYSAGGGGYNAVKCVPVARDAVPPGGACQVEGSITSGYDDCETGAICLGVDADTLIGTCVAQCNGTLDEPDCSHVAGTACLIADDGIVTVCLPTCDPLLQDCGAGQGCVVTDEAPPTFLCIPDASGEQGQVFDPCSSLDGCDPGLACAEPDAAVECDAMADGCCVPYCNPDAPGCPGAGQQCLPITEEVGRCGLP